MPPAQEAFRFTESQDWCTAHFDTWRKSFTQLPQSEVRVLEIGTWEGRSAVFFASELCRDDGEIVCIDHFDSLQTEAGKERYEKVVHNLSLTQTSHRILKSFSFPALSLLLREELVLPHPGFHLVLIDGSHRADDTMLDAELVWRLTRQGGIVIFDDYEWPDHPDTSIEHPKPGIDAFLLLHSGEFEILHRGYQIILKKLTTIRVGFSYPPSIDEDSHISNAEAHFPSDAVINIMMCIDDNYAMPASIALKSLIHQTTGSISIYIISVRLTASHQQKIEKSVGSDSRLAIKFIPIPEDSLTNVLKDVSWARIDAMELITAERVLYLDADVIIRKDIRPLWETDLKAYWLGAARDVGFPEGYDEAHRVPYFNSGVLLMNLKLLREKVAIMKAEAHKMHGSRFQDQDMLNYVCRGKFKELSLTWNAQGLGTYAREYKGERDALDDPAIVHFTGPVHPSLADVLNKYNQPFLAKPWGYAGAPGHPYTALWHEVKDQTAWSGWDFAEHQRLQVELQIASSIQEFRLRLL